MIQIQNLTKRFKNVSALSNVSLEVRANEVVALWGPNGAGKTTLLRAMLGILHFGGNIVIAGLDVKKEGKKVRSLIGYVPQEIRLHLDQTVWETVTFYAGLKGVNKERMELLIREWGLSDSKTKLAQTLSGGMRQKLALITALLSDPPILLLDEPTSNLDVSARRDFAAAVERLKTAGKTLFFCSHRMQETRRIADRVILLESGVKKADACPEEVEPLIAAMENE